MISTIQSLLPCAKTKEKSQIAPNIGCHFALHRRKDPCSSAPKKIGTHYRWRPSTRNSVWVQNQQGHHRHGVRFQTAPREMQGLKQRTVCSVCGPDQSVWRSEQKETEDEHRAPWLPLKVPQHGYPTAQVRPSEVEPWLLWILPYRQRREKELCSGTDSVQHLFQHDA